MNDTNIRSAYKKIRRLEIIVGLLFVLVAVLIYLSFFKTLSYSSVVQAKAFQLTNEVGNVMAGLEFQDRYPSFYVRDNDGQKRLVATHDEDGTHIFLNDQSGTTRVGIAHFSHGDSGIALHGENSKGAAVLYFKEKGSLTFFDADGSVTNQIQAQENPK